MPDPTSPFTSMVITFDTGSDDKDNDTRLEIGIFEPPFGNPLAAYYDDGRDDHLDNGSEKSFVVPPKGTGFVLGDLPVQVIMIKITPHGDDTWRFSFRATLNFADGTRAVLSQTAEQVLDQDANQLIYPLRGAQTE
jgi:hypothetical protein